MSTLAVLRSPGFTVYRPFPWRNYSLPTENANFNAGLSVKGPDESQGDLVYKSVA
jgi:hypothetical protein